MDIILSFKSFLLCKLAEALDVPVNEDITKHFPFLTNQQIWKYKHHDGKLILKDKDNVYTFSWPNELYPPLLLDQLN